jgi:hypothetical protein
MIYTLKYKRPTLKEHGHTAISVNDVTIGYFMLERARFVALYDNWYLCINKPSYPIIDKYFRTRKQLIAFLDALVV